jgi:hypothetical protein
MRHLLYNRILPVLTFVPIVFGLIGYVLSRITDMTIVMWELVMLASILLCVGVVLATKIPYVTTQSEHNPRAMSWWFVLALIALPMLVMLPGLWALLTDTGVQAITHTDFHASLINQIIHGTFPPVNPQIPDLPIGYYWLYHALIAVPSHLFNIAAPLISVALIYSSLVMALLYLWLIVEELGFERRQYLVMSTLIMIILFNGNLFGVFHAWEFVVRDGLQFISRRAMVLEGEPRLYGLWTKYINYNSMPLTMMYFVMGVYGVLRILRGHITIANMTLVSFSIIGGTIFLFVPGFFLGATFAPALLVVYVVYRLQTSALSQVVRDVVSDIRQVFAQYTLRTWLLLIVSLGVLYLVTVVVGLHVLSLFPTAGDFSLGSRFNLDSIVGVNYPMIPFLLMGVWLAVWKNDRFSQLMVLATLIGFAMSYVFQLSDNNQYKFVMQTSLYVGLITARVLYYWIYEAVHIGWKRLGYVSMVIIIALIWVNMSLIELGFVQIALDDSQPYQYDGRYINGKNSDYQAMFHWIRENTPPDTLVIQPLEMEAFYTSLYSERLPYLGVFQFEFSKGIVEYDEREHALGLFYDPFATLSQRIEAVRKFRQYDGERSTMIMAMPSELEIPDEQLQNLGFTFAHEVDNARLYWFRRDGQYPPLVYVDDNQPLQTIFTFGDEQAIALQAIQTAFDDSLTACDAAWVTTWWTATETPPTDYLMKLVLVSGDGAVVTSVDVVPSAIPMTRWELNTAYSDTQYLDVPCDTPAGEYQLLMGMYEIDYDTSEFVADLPVFYQGGAVGNLGFIKTVTVDN